jgi:hypothetical protein
MNDDQAREILAVVTELCIKRPGWAGGYSTRQALGGWRNGTRVEKAAEDATGDLTKMGTLGTVLGSVMHPELGMAYFIEWDDKPKVAVLCVQWKLKARP